MITLTSGVGSFTIGWTPLSDPDVAGYVVCGVHNGGVDFSVASTNIINIGTETSFAYYTSQSGQWSVKVAAYDSFCDPKNLILSTLNFSSLLVVSVWSFGSQTTSALTGTGVLQTGKVNGVDGTVGINGALIIDGSLVVSQSVAVGGNVTIGGAVLSFAAPTAVGIGAIKTDLTNAPSTILKSSISLGTLGYTGATNADVTSTILSSGVLTVGAALSVTNYLDVTGTSAFIRVGSTRTSFDPAVTTPGIIIGNIAGVANALFYTDTNNYLKYDGTGVTVKGKINATSGTFSGTISSTGSILGGTFSTAPSGNARAELSSSNNRLSFYDSSNTERVAIGLNTTAQTYAGSSYLLVSAPGTGACSAYFKGGLVTMEDGLNIYPNGAYAALEVQSRTDGCHILFSASGTGTPTAAYPMQGMLRATGTGLYYYTGSSWTKIA
jgi:hypothetical protein